VDNKRQMKTKFQSVVHPRSIISNRLMFFVVAFIGLAFTGAPRVTAEDRVFLRTASGSGTSRVVGEVEDYTGMELVLRQLGGRQQTYPTDRVLRVESDWSAPHQVALAKYQQRAYQESLDAYLQALRVEKRKWVQRQQLAQITWCYRNLGQLAQASASFMALYRSDPTTIHLPAIPLIWGASPPDVAAERRAADLLADASQPAGQLIGASWLLTTAKRAEAQQTLRALTNASDARIIFLAEAQTWRTEQATLTATDIQRMQARIDAMPGAIRAGPYFQLGIGQARLGDSERAALSLLRIPINFPEDRLLAAQALLAAGQELSRAKRPDEARGLYREIIVDFADTPSAEIARQRHAAHRP